MSEHCEGLFRDNYLSFIIKRNPYMVATATGEWNIANELLWKFSLFNHCLMTSKNTDIASDKWMITNSSGYKIFHCWHYFLLLLRQSLLLLLLFFAFHSSIIHRFHSCVNITKLDTKPRTEHSFHLKCAHIFQRTCK